jgi:YVTN family beta-propeller protein
MSLLAACAAMLVAISLAVPAPYKAAVAREQRIRRARLMQGYSSAPPAEGGQLELHQRKIIPVGRWPKGVELTPDQSEAWVTNFSDNSITVIDAQTLQVKQTVPTKPDSPVEIAWFPDGKRALITGGYERSQLMIFDLASHEIIGRIDGKTTGKWTERRMFPKVATFSPGGERFYVSYWDTSNVGIYDSTTFELQGLVSSPVNPRGIAITPDGKKAYVCNFDNKGDSLTVFAADEAPFKVLATIAPLPNPRHVVISADGRFAYASLFGARGGLVKVDTSTDKVVATSTPTGWRGKTVKLSPDGRWLFLTNFGADTISVFDADSLAEVTREPTGREPCGLDVAKDGKTLWTTDWSDNQVRVWDIVLKGPEVAAGDVPPKAP